MPKFESQLGNKSFAGQPLKEIDIPDDGEYQQPPVQRGVEYNFQMDEQAMRDFQERIQPPQRPQSIQESTEIERQIREAKDARRTGKERLSDGAKRRIAMLINMTRLTKQVEIDGQMYALQALKGVELRDAVVGAAEFNNTVQFEFELRKQLLARSLTHIAGVEIEQFLYSRDLNDKLMLIEELDHALSLRLYNEYISLANEAQTKYSIKTNDQAQEVVEDLKK